MCLTVIPRSRFKEFNPETSVINNLDEESANYPNNPMKSNSSFDNPWRTLNLTIKLLRHDHENTNQNSNDMDNRLSRIRKIGVQNPLSEGIQTSLSTLCSIHSYPIVCYKTLQKPKK